MLDSRGRVFGFINIIDLCAILIVLAGLLGFFMVKSGAHKTSAQIVKDNKEIEFDIFTRGQKIISPDSLFKGEDSSFLTIRNVPYTKLKIVKYVCNQWQVPVLHPDNNTGVSIDDPSAPNTYNCIITLSDTAEITTDGPVIGGNKIKVGLKVDIEGFKYRLPGVVADVRVKE